MIYILYHKNCMDGNGAAFAAYKKFGESATYIPVNYGEDIPSMPNAEEIYILDFSFPKQILLDMAEKAKVVVLDHHKTAEADLKDLTFAKFDMNKSGAMMAWEYFHGTDRIHTSISHIQDRDLWQFKLADTKAFSAGAYTLIRDFRDLGRINTDDLIDSGESILAYQEQTLQSLLNNAYLEKQTFDGIEYSVAKCNSPVLQSELGNALLSKFPTCDFAWVYREDAEKVYVSLRSSEEKADVSKIAKLLGGGGHRNASGLTMERK